jgi:hypothetical protein
MEIGKAMSAWAIREDYVDIDGKAYPRLLGYGCFDWSRPSVFGGYVTATWKTRKEAQEALKDLRRRSGYQRTKVVRVEVSLSEQR